MVRVLDEYVRALAYIERRALLRWETRLRSPAHGTRHASESDCRGLHRCVRTALLRSSQRESTPHQVMELVMNQRMFGNLSARRVQLGHRLDALRHSHLWRSRDGAGASVGVQDAAHIVQEQPLGDVPRKEQRTALNTWEDEGGATKRI